MNICFVTNYYPPKIVGGAELYLRDLVDHLRQFGHRVSVVTNCPGVLFEDDEIYNLAIEPNPVRLGLLLADPQIDAAVRDILEEIKPDVVHVHNTHSTLGFGIYEAVSTWPNVVTIHDYQLFCLIGVNYRTAGRACDDRRYCHGCAQRFYRNESDVLGLVGWKKIATQLVERFSPLARALVWIRNRERAIRFARSIDKVICVSAAVANTMGVWGIAAEKLIVLNNGLPNSPRTVTPQGSEEILRLGYIGRLTDAKGVRMLMAALAILEKDEISYQLTIAGVGPAVTGLETMVRDLRLSGVRFVGQLDRDAVEDFYASVDVVVVPSVWPDPLPVVIQEAMARRKLVIGASIGGIAELLGDGCGMTFRSADPRDLAKVLKTARAFERRDATAESGFQRFQSRYRIDSHRSDIEAVYRSVIAARGDGVRSPGRSRLPRAHYPRS